MWLVGAHPVQDDHVEAAGRKRVEAPEESREVRLIHPKADPVPVSIDIGAGGGHSPLRLPKRMDYPPPLASVAPAAAFREARLNGFPETLAEVHRHCGDGGRRRISDAAPRGCLTPVSWFKQASQPAHAMLNIATGEGVLRPPDPLLSFAPAAFAVWGFRHFRGVRESPDPAAHRRLRG